MEEGKRAFFFSSLGTRGQPFSLLRTYSPSNLSPFSFRFFFLNILFFIIQVCLLVWFSLCTIFFFSVSGAFATCTLCFFFPLSKPFHGLFISLHLLLAPRHGDFPSPFIFYFFIILLLVSPLLKCNCKIFPFVVIYIYTHMKLIMRNT